MRRYSGMLLALLLTAGMLGGCQAAPQTAGNQAAETETAERDPYGAAGDPAVTLVYAEVNPQSSITGQLAAAFQEKCEEFSGGSVTIDVRYAGVLGAEEEVLADMISGEGEAQIARISAFNLTNQGTSHSPVLSLPFTFSSREHFWKFATSPLAEVVMGDTDSTLPVKGLFYGEEGFRNFFTREPISSYNDLEGMKIRISDDPIMETVVSGLGAKPVYVPFTELYSALQHKKVDAAEQPIINYESNMFPEVALNLLLDEHTLGVIEIIITDEAWASLTEAQQEAVLAAGAYAQTVNRQSIEETEAATLQALRKNGVNIIELPEKDQKLFRKKCRSLIHNYTQGVTKDLYNKILELE